MGYHSINTGTVTRDYDKRKLVASVWCDELEAGYKEEFEWDDFRHAFAWIEAKMKELSM